MIDGIYMKFLCMFKFIYEVRFFLIVWFCNRLFCIIIIIVVNYKNENLIKLRDLFSM